MEKEARSVEIIEDLPGCLQNKEADGMGEGDISGIIRKDRQERTTGHFEGTFLEYAELVKKEPEAAILAHQKDFRPDRRAGWKR